MDMNCSCIWFWVTNPASRKRLPQTPGAGGEAHYSGRWGKGQEPEAGVHCRGKRGRGAGVEKTPSRKRLASLAALAIDQDLPIWKTEHNKLQSLEDAMPHY